MNCPNCNCPNADPIIHTPKPEFAYIFWFLCFLGLFGVHRFYSGRWVTGILWLLTGGLFLIGQIIDLVLIPGQCRHPKWQYT
ncbi:TM2 domain-containing protein [Poriferisphaera corsica]|uniref:TM2 domain-containing protein n=1 Tax=Poriferisphaera corsica TaxID=2528020 RepID=UPI0011A75A46|nr:NINE protein [Poriferisphaera corsica]